MKRLQDAIDQVINGLTIMKEYIQDINESSVLSTLAPVQSNKASTISMPVTALSTSINKEEEDLGDFEQLKIALNSTRWPEAVNKNLICDPNIESDKIDRGKGIIELSLNNNISNLKFLDFGCGEAYTIPYASDVKKTSKAIGYDIKQYDSWSKFNLNNALTTTDWNTVIENGPYDIILLFDVLDHLKNEIPEVVLNKVKNVLSDTGTIYLRCHPYLSRHATHIYYYINKAFIHLVFTEDELKTLIPESPLKESNIGVIYPLSTYAKYFENCKLTVVDKREIRDTVDSFFKIPKIAQRIIENSKLKSFPEFQMGFSFLDYTLKKS